jgi:hypothetical protein
MKLLTALVAALALLACGCASRPTVEQVALEPLPEFEVAFSGRSGQQAIEDLPKYASPNRSAGAGYEIETRIVCGPSDEVTAYFGPAIESVEAWQTTETGLNKNIVGMERRGLKVAAVPTITAFHDQAGTIAITRDISYLSGFECASGQQGFIEHPYAVDDNLFVGIVLTLKAETIDESSVHLSLDLKLLDDVQSAAAQDLDAGGTSVAVRSPVHYDKQLRCDGKLSEGGILVLTGAADDGRAYVVMLKASRKNAVGTK